jgi:hypothetical protein
MVHFIFVARTLGDFNDHFNFHTCHFMPWGDLHNPCYFGSLAV